AQVQQQLDAISADTSAQQSALAGLGDLTFDLDHLTRVELERTLGRPNLTQKGPKNATLLGWACGKDHCAIWSSYPVRFGQEIPPNLPAAAMILNATGFAPSRRLAVAGVYLGEPVDEMQEFCRKNGCVPLEKHRLRWWLKDWSFVWIDTSGKISWLVFLN